MEQNFRVSRVFKTYSDSDLEVFGNNVASNLDAKKFPNLPVSPSDIGELTGEFSTALAATISGGPKETAVKDKARKALLEALNQDANIVEVVAKHDLELLLTSGYQPASTNRASVPLDPPAVAGLENLASTQVLLRLVAVTNAKSYQVQLSADSGKTWQEACISPQARRIVLTNLTPGTTYVVRARAIGGSTGASDWVTSGPIMAT
jgi:hypothetical protein